MRLQQDRGRLDWVRVHSSRYQPEWECEVGVRLDYTSSHTSRCRRVAGEEAGPGCNGSPEFCRLRLDQFLWPGSHNSGTGQQEGSLPCMFKNQVRCNTFYLPLSRNCGVTTFCCLQDLDIVEQLEFGIRFLDIDTIVSRAGGCSGLETGHGSHPAWGVYQVGVAQCPALLYSAG